MTSTRDHGYHPLRVVRVVEETPDAKSFVFDTPDGFRYRPGQFCTFRFLIGGEEYLRCYSMSSAPETDPELTVTVKRVADGIVSNWCNDVLSAGDVVEAANPTGVFCSDSTATGPVLAFCGGSGVTPVISIVKHVLMSSARTVRVLYANKDRTSVIFDAAWAALAARHPDRLELRHHLDDDGGFLTASAIRDWVGRTSDAEYFICGPGPFMDLVESTLLELGISSDAIAIERFGSAPAPSSDDVSDADTAGAGAATPTISVCVTLKGSTTTVPYQRGDTLLEAARRGGIGPPFSCEAGNCASCMALVTTGSATMRVNNALSPAEVAEGWVLTCQAFPVGATVSIEYESY